MSVFVTFLGRGLFKPLISIQQTKFCVSKYLFLIFCYVFVSLKCGRIILIDPAVVTQPSADLSVMRSNSIRGIETLLGKLSI